jgi:hypothetical protein
MCIPLNMVVTGLSNPQMNIPGRFGVSRVVGSHRLQLSVCLSLFSWVISELSPSSQWKKSSWTEVFQYSNPESFQQIARNLGKIPILSVFHSQIIPTTPQIPLRFRANAAAAAAAEAVPAATPCALQRRFKRQKMEFFTNKNGGFMEVKPKMRI